MPAAAEPIDLSLVLPCFNEEQIFAANSRRILATLDHLRLRYEIILVDDASRDRTRELILALENERPEAPVRHIFHEGNRGRGAAVRSGFAAAAGEAVGFIDIDLEVGPEHILPCWLALRDGADVAVGRRFYRVRWRALFRHFLSRGYAAVVRAALELPYDDTESGYKFFRRRAWAELENQATDPGWFWDTQVMAAAHDKSLRVAEIPCLFVRRTDKTSTVRPLHDAIVYLKRLRSFRRTRGSTT